MAEGRRRPPSLRDIARAWGRIGVTGFGGPPTHIALLRRLCVDERGWMSTREFQDAVAATSLLPGPASTQLAILCAWRLRGAPGALVGGLCFIVPGLVLILALAVPLLARHPPRWVDGAAAGAGAVVPVVAVRAALGLLPGSWAHTARRRGARIRWAAYLAVGAVAGAVAGPYLVVVLLAGGLAEVAATGPRGDRWAGGMALAPLLGAAPAVAGGVGALLWVAFKVGALSYGGGFVIVPLMQHDAVSAYHWLTGPQFLGAVALGQVTPGPVVQTVAVVGYAARGVGGGVLAAAVAFAPSFVFVLAGARHFARIRTSPVAQAFLGGAGPAAVGAIAGASVPLGLALAKPWQLGVLAAGALWLVGLRRGIVPAVVGAAVVGALAVVAGAPVPR